MRAKLHERTRVWQQNKELVTKNCGQQSHIASLQRQTETLKRRIDELEAAKRATEIQATAAISQPPRVYRDFQAKQNASRPRPPSSKPLPQSVQSLRDRHP